MEVHNLGMRDCWNFVLAGWPCLGDRTESWTESFTCLSEIFYFIMCEMNIKACMTDYDYSCGSNILVLICVADWTVKHRKDISLCDGRTLKFHYFSLSFLFLCKNKILKLCFPKREEFIISFFNVLLLFFPSATDETEGYKFVKLGQASGEYEWEKQQARCLSSDPESQH